VNNLKEREYTSKIPFEDGHGRSHYSKNYNNDNKKMISVVAIIIAILAIFLIIKLNGAPKVEIIGQSTVEVEFGTEYKDEGVKAKAKFKDISNQVIVESNVDTSKLGTYTVTYKVPHSKSYDTYTRTVVVKDTTGPEITLNGGEEYRLQYGSTYEEPGFEAKDACDGDVKDKVTTAKVDTENGNFDMHYVVEDSRGNKSEKVRHVIFTDLTRIFPPDPFRGAQGFLSR